MVKFAFAEVFVDDGKGRAGNTRINPESARHTADKGCFSRAEVAVERNNRARGQRFGKTGAGGFGFRLAVGVDRHVLLQSKQFIKIFNQIIITPISHCVKCIIVIQFGIILKKINGR